jgi:hypothetical protein
MTHHSNENWDRVEADLFVAGSGKWKYRVFLDYSDTWHRLQSPSHHPDGYLRPETAAWAALRKATEMGNSEVSVCNSQDGYFALVVRNPPNGWPIMALGSSDKS